ncbi:MAG: hypothetical protein ACXVPD_14285, partial [Bacteroidia bacterium]
MQRQSQIVKQAAKKWLAFLLLLCFFSGAQGQLLDSVSVYHAEEYDNLDSALKHPDAVIKLVLKRKHLKSFPMEVFQFKNLQYLDISKNSIKELPEGLGQLKYL